MTSADFDDAAVPMALLRQQAHNQRWAELPEGTIPLTAADPDFAVATPIREAMARHAREGVFSYGPPGGLPRFREAVAHWFTHRRGVRCGPADVFATDGAAAAMHLAAQACLRPGDEALILDPVDFLFAAAIERAGARAVRVPFCHGTSTAELLDALDQARTPRTRMLWLCNPHNPLGLALPAPMLQALAGWALQHGLRLLVDEVWSDIVYPPLRHQAAAALDPETARNTLTVYGFSKNFGLAGLRVGCLLCPDRVLAARLADAAGAAQTISGVATLSQWAAVAAMEEAEPWLDAFVAHLDRQRRRLAERAGRWPHIKLVMPQATFVALLDARAVNLDEEALCRRLRDEARVALVPGSARWFGPGAAGHLRLSFATSRGILDEALDRIDRFLGVAGPGPARGANLSVACP